MPRALASRWRVKRCKIDPSTTRTQTSRCRISIRTSANCASRSRPVRTIRTGVRRHDVQPGARDRRSAASQRHRRGAAAISISMRSLAQPTTQRGRPTCCTATTSFRHLRVSPQRQGYPIVQVPAGMVFGVPLGVSFFGTAFSEPKLIKLASGFEAVTRVRAHNLPTFARTVPFDHIAGTTLHPLLRALPAGGGQSV